MPDADDPASEGQETLEEVVGSLVDSIVAGEDDKNARPVDGLDALSKRDKEQDLRLKGIYGIWVLVIVSVQVLVVNVLMFLYAGLGRHWDVTGTVLQVWLSATVVELIGVLAIVARYLFPRRDGH